MRLQVPFGGASGLLLILIGAAGCGDDAGPAITVDPTVATYENVWPAVDGSSWSYRSEYRLQDVPAQVDASAEDVPTTPSVDELYGLLEQQLPTQPSILDFAYRLGPTVPGPDGVTRRLTTEGRGLVLCGAYSDRLRWSLNGIRAASDFSESDWLFIGNSVELDEQVDWSASGLVEMHTRVVRRGRCTALGTVYLDCVECMTWCGWKPRVITDDAGVELGYVLAFHVTSVVFAPGLGPVEIRARHVIGPDSVTGQPVARIATYDLVLVQPDSSEFTCTGDHLEIDVTPRGG